MKRYLFFLKENGKINCLTLTENILCLISNIWYIESNVVLKSNRINKKAYMNKLYNLITTYYHTQKKQWEYSKMWRKKCPS